MQKRHTDRKTYFNEQAETTKKYVIPFVNEFIEFNNQTRVLEIGCGEGDNLFPFVNLGCSGVGADMNQNKINNANLFFAEHQHAGSVDFILTDIYKAEDIGTFDFIFMRDVLEHIHNQSLFMDYVKRFLKPRGLFFLGFPPFQNPFGGHQQICKHKVLASMPYYHILPTPIYRGILRLFKEPEKQIEDLLEVKETGSTIEQFERIIKNSKYKVVKRCFYLINPNYEIKFGLKPRKQFKLIASVPFLRNFLTTTNYYLLSAR